MSLKHHLLAFFKSLTFQPKKLLIGLSGGADSRALLFLLLEVKEQMGFELGVAHVDHNWRKESGEEALTLKRLAEQFKLPFFLKTLNFRDLKGNLEEVCRLERLNFFQNICERDGYEGVLLGHHANDQAETVMKRLFEGSSLVSLKGMEAVKAMGSLLILRPFLTRPKSELGQFLQQRQQPYFEDATNCDPSFLRGRMRSALFPEIEKQFGKNIQKNLIRLSDETTALAGYFQEKLKPVFANQILSSWGLCLDLTILNSRYEIKWALHLLFQREKIALSHAQLEAAADLLYSKEANKKFQNNGSIIIVDRGFLFLIKGVEDASNESFQLEEGHYKWGSWQVVIERQTEEKAPCLGWKQAWKGACQAILPAGQYRLGGLEPFSKTKLVRLWTNEKVPAFFRHSTPIIYDENFEVALDFLSGRQYQKKKSGLFGIMVSLYRE